jgi:hypothetical protein
MKNTATTDSVVINSDTGVIKTALILEPFRGGFLDSLPDISEPKLVFTNVAQQLVENGYAVTNYADAGVSRDLIKNQLDKYTISIVRTHGLGMGEGLYFTKISDFLIPGHTE